MNLHNAKLPLHFLIGPTASGKSAVALSLAPRINAEILSMDSMAVYRGIDVLAAKPSASERARAPHHLIDIVEPHETFSVGRYVEVAEGAVRDITIRGRRALFVGGTPLYLKALAEGFFDGPPADHDLRARLSARAAAEGTWRLHSELSARDPTAASRIHPNDLRRIVRALEVLELTGRPISEWQTQFGNPSSRYHCTVIGLRWDRRELYRRIEQRVDEMFERGLIEEVRKLREHQPPVSLSASQALGYREVGLYLEGKISLAEARTLLQTHTRQFARRQLIWFRTFRNIHWVDVSAADTAENVAERIANIFFPAAAQGSSS